MGAADIYITPYRQEAQVVSGTLAIALGAGKAIVSTPYWHAKELLATRPRRDCSLRRSSRHREAVLTSAGERRRTPCHAEARLSSFAGDHLAEDSAAYMASFQRARLKNVCSQEPRCSDCSSSAMSTQLPALNTRSPATHDGRHGHLAARHLLRAQFQRGLYDRRQCPRADRVALCCMNCADIRRRIPIYQSLPPVSGISLACISIRYRAVSGTFSATIATGWKMLAQKTATAVLCGLWERCSADSRNRRLARGAPAGSLKPRSRRRLKFTSPRAWAFSILGMQAYLDWFPGDRADSGRSQCARQSPARHL